jgi:hypothetical protein
MVRNPAPLQTSIGLSTAPTEKLSIIEMVNLHSLNSGRSSYSFDLGLSSRTVVNWFQGNFFYFPTPVCHMPIRTSPKIEIWWGRGSWKTCSVYSY